MLVFFRIQYIQIYLNYSDVLTIYFSPNLFLVLLDMTKLALVAYDIPTRIRAWEPAFHLLPFMQLYMLIEKV